MNYEEVILNHYKKVAGNNGLQPTSTMRDQYIRCSEIDFIIAEISKYETESKLEELTILDVGCGNGYLLSVLREKFKTARLFGVEFTPELYELAYSRDIENCKIVHGDCRKDSFFEDREVDIVITERVIVNILSKRGQYESLANIGRCVKLGGLYLMVESFQESLRELNLARREMSIEPLSESYQNRYLCETRVKFLDKKGFKEIEGVVPRNFLSSYFYITRVFHNSIRPEGGKVKYSRFVDFFSKVFPPAIGNFSPIQFRVFKKFNSEGVV